MPKTNLGEGVYADWNGSSLTLTTEDDTLNQPENTIRLDMEVCQALLKLIDGGCTSILVKNCIIIGDATECMRILQSAFTGKDSD